MRVCVCVFWQVYELKYMCVCVFVFVCVCLCVCVCEGFCRPMTGRNPHPLITSGGPSGPAKPSLLA